ncbi:MAG: HAD family phosphatase [Candidatus Binataceae bacterium]|jgi:HAD superfamily hydrolase (TIGR01509 family)
MIRAIIFDLDGTLADSEPLHFAAFAELLAAEGIALSREEYFEHLIGYTDHDCFAVVMREHGRPADEATVARLAARKATLYQEMIANRDLLYPGAAEFVRRCAARVPIAVATGTLRDEAELILGRAGLRKLFVDVVAAEDVANGKPAPDSFLAAHNRIAERLNPPLKRDECLVIEDTAAGIEAGRRAGMKVLAIAHSALPSDLVKADLVRNSLAEIDLDDILRRLS